jgi:WD40 repeat protein
MKINLRIFPGALFASIVSVLTVTGKTIASASADGTVKLWNLEGKLLKTLLVPPEE